MDPTTCDIQIRPFLIEFVIHLVPICDHGSGEVLQELSRVIGASGWLPVKQDDRRGFARRAVSVDPHISLPAVFDLFAVYPHNLSRCFVCMDDLVVINEFVQPVIYKGQVRIRAFYDPVG